MTKAASAANGKPIVAAKCSRAISNNYGSCKMSHAAPNRNTTVNAPAPRTTSQLATTRSRVGLDSSGRHDSSKALRVYKMGSNVTKDYYIIILASLLTR